MEKYAIKAENLTKKFGEKTAVNGINLSIKEGEIYGLLGPNGAGKSTTIKMLITLLAPTEGDAWILGKSILNDSDEVRFNIGVALQESSLDGQQTGLELLRFQGRLYGLTEEEIDSRIEELIRLVDIGDSINKLIKTYSGGMKRRLDLAASLIHNPNVLFLDEPTTGLDPISRNKVWEQIRKLNKEFGMTILLTTQYLEEADQLADRVGIISQSKLVVEGTPRELKQKVGGDVIIANTKTDVNGTLERIKKMEGVKEINVKDDEISIIVKNGSSLIGKIAVEFEKDNVELDHLTLRTTSLDDVFLEYTGNRLQENN
jgi:ABC-2 type transport system ATP-binding protein